MVDLDRLLKLRLVVARVGEMDLAQWWNTRGQLGPLGAAALRRGLPRTHYFAQARSVMAVAAHRCAEVFDLPGSVTLWRLPQSVEEQFDAQWEHWLDNGGDWDPFFRELAELNVPDLASALTIAGLATETATASLANVPVSDSGHAIQLPGTYAGTDEDIMRLAIAFARGGVGSLVVPYARLEVS